MKLRNKKTGEIIDDGYVRETYGFQFDGHVLAVFKGNGHTPPERVSGAYKTLAELNEEWEDCEEPDEYWFIAGRGAVEHSIDRNDVYDKGHRELGNYFETREEAEKAVEKLKAWKRLKDKGFRFDGWEDLQAEMGRDDLMLFNRDVIDTDNVIGFRMDDYHDCIKDLNICFGGEE